MWWHHDEIEKYDFTYLVTYRLTRVAFETKIFRGKYVSDILMWIYRLRGNIFCYILLLSCWGIHNFESKKPKNFLIIFRALPAVHQKCRPCGWGCWLADLKKKNWHHLCFQLFSLKDPNLPAKFSYYLQIVRLEKQETSRMDPSSQ